MLLDGSTGCCGVDWGPSPVSFYRVFTRSTPFVLLFIIGYPLIAILGRTASPAGKLAHRLNERFRNSMDEIERSRILPKQKCLISGRLFAISPALAGLIFKSFNLAALSIVWIVCLATAAAVYALAF